MIDFFYRNYRFCKYQLITDDLNFESKNDVDFVRNEIELKPLEMEIILCFLIHHFILYLNN